MIIAQIIFDVAFGTMGTVALVLAYSWMRDQ